MTSPNAPLSDRDVRQRDLIPPQRLAVCQALVVGVGAVGRQVALQLAAMGVAAMDLVDYDVVAVENLAPQGYWPADLGEAKVWATGTLCRCVNPDLQLRCHTERFRSSSGRMLPCFRVPGSHVALFCCVDSITTRRMVWDATRHRVEFFVDGRMAAEVIRTLAVDHPAVDEHYPSTLFEPGQVYAGSCTAKSTIYTASMAAGLMLSQFTRWLRGLPVERDLTLNLLSSELSVS